jgi:hypothetical protein
MSPLLAAWSARLKGDVLWVDRLVGIWRGRPLFLRMPPPPWSAGTALLYCAATGLILVVLQAFGISLLREYWPASDWSGCFTAIGFVPPVVLLLAGLMHGFVARRTRSRLFSRAWRLGGLGLVALLPAAAGLWGATWCRNHHVCMGGHMDHPPYDAFHFQWDAAWLLCLILSGVLFLASRSYHVLLFVVLFTYLVLFRFWLGSMGGILPYSL